MSRKYKKIRTYIAALMSACILITGINVYAIETNAEPTEEVEVVIEEIVEVVPIQVEETPVEEVISDVEVIQEVEEIEEPVEEIIQEEVEEIAVIEESYSISEEDIRLIALVTMAEAEGESELGKRLVIDTILNRVDSDNPYYPDTVHDVIYQKHQFEAVWNGRIDRCYVMDDIVQLVKEELQSRTNYDVMFFRTLHYSEYGIPMFQEGNHYFSSY